MNPSYRSLVDPWSIRGFESVHGAIALTIGLGLAALAAATRWHRSSERNLTIGIVAAAVVFAIVLGFVFDPGEDFGFSAFLAFVFAFLISMIGMRLAQRWLMRDLPAGSKPKTSISFLIWVGGFVVLVAILLPMSSDDTKLSFPIVVAIVFILLGVLSLATAPLELAAPRMTIYSSLLAGATIGLGGGAIRSTLIRLQSGAESTIGFPAQFKDTQVTWGYFLANIGILLVFIGAVSIWGRRRDALQAAARIAAQRAAAEQSAAEIEAARVAAGL